MGLIKVWCVLCEAPEPKMDEYWFILCTLQEDTSAFRLAALLLLEPIFIFLLLNSLALEADDSVNSVTFFLAPTNFTLFPGCEPSGFEVIALLQLYLSACNELMSNDMTTDKVAKRTNRKAGRMLSFEFTVSLIFMTLVSVMSKHQGNSSRSAVGSASL